MKNLQLGISAIVVIMAGLIYGFNPRNILTQFLGFEIADPELGNIFKAIMGLYLAMGVFWIVGIAKTAYWKAATLSNVLFMGGITFGRGLGLLLDGFSLHFAIAMMLEVFMMFWGLYNLTMQKGQIN